jgi:23S rRNA pseudouridine2605 synthase
VPKVYEADVEGSPSRDGLEALRGGIELDDGRTAPADLRVLSTSRRRSRIELTLHEGRNRQVRRMLEAVGHPVGRLHRSRYAGLGLEGLQEGQWRTLTPREVASLRSAVGL